MAIRYKSNIDLGGLALQNATLHPESSAPSNPVEGQIWWDTSNKKLFIYDVTNTRWTDVTGDVTSISSGTGITVVNGSGGDAAVALSHLGIEDLTAPEKLGIGYDGIMFYDTSNGATKWLSVADASGININNLTLELANIPNASLTNSSLTITKGNGLTSTSGGAVSLGGSVTITVGQGVGISVEANGVALKNHAALGANTLMMWDDTNGQLTDSVITQDATTSAVTIDDDLIVSGDLTVQGSLTSIETTNTAITDNVIVLNKGESGAGVSSVYSGFEVDRGTESNVSFLWDDTNDRWQVGGKLKLNTVATASNVASVYVEEDVAGAGEIRKININDLKELMGSQNLSLSLEVSGGVKPVGELWVTKANNTYTVEHYLGTKYMIAQVHDATSGENIMVDITRTDDDTMTVAFAQAVTDGDYILNIQVTTAKSHGDGGGAAGGQA